MRALLVDSDELTRTACSALVTAANIDSTALQTIDQLPNVLADSSPDLVIISGDLDGVPGDEIAELVQMCGFDPEFSTVFIARTADSMDCRDQLHSSGLELILPENGGAEFVQRVLWRASCGRIHALENSSLTRRIDRLERVVSALNQHALVSETDGSGVIRHVNEKFCEVSGFSRQELIGRDHRVTNSGMTPEALADMWRTISRGETWHGNICNRARDGRLFWVQTTIVPWSDNNSARYRYYSVRTDITYLKEVERTLSLRGQAIEAATNGITLADMSQPDYPMVEVNSAFERMTGYERTELIGHNCRFLQAGAAQHDKTAEIRQAMAESRPIATVLLNYRKDGTPFWNELRLSPIFDDTGEVTHYLGIQHDVTRYIEAEQAAVEANEAKSRFLSRMSHELRTPLNAVAGFAQLLATDEALSDDQRRNAEEIVSAGNHLVALVDEVLDLSRIENDRLEVQVVVLELGPLLNSCLSQVRGQADARQVVLDWDGRGGWIRGDRTRVHQVLLNLLSNAIKYNREGGRVRIECSAGARGCMRVSVSDSGLGIAPESQRRLFQPFERLESSYSSIEGTGIGLALTERLVDAMDGAIGVDSEPGVGSTFWFELPAAAAADAADGGTQPAGRG